MTVTNDTVNFIKKFEGLSLEPYADNKQWSIGYGTFAGPYPGPKPSLKLTGEQQAHDLMMKDLTGREKEIKSKLKRNISQNQYSALLSFAYNTGVGAASKVIDIINQGDISRAAAKMLEYVYSGGKKLNALVKRRESEVSLFITPEPLYKANTQDTGKRVILSVLVIVAVTVLLFKWNF